MTSGRRLLLAASPVPAFSPTKSVKVINGYALVTLVGSGPRSRVHLAVSSASDVPFAVKSIPVGFDWTGLTLQREIRLHRWVDHPNLVKLHDVFHARRTQIAYLFFEWAAYGPLSAFVRQRLPEKTIAAIFAQVSAALAYLHSQGIVHHNVTPANILLFSGGVAKLSHLEICDSFETVDSIVGSPGYQAPEDFFDGQDDLVIDPVKEDVWSLGISIYETAFGRRPYQGNTVYEIMQNILNSTLEIPAGASQALRDLLVQMLDINPESRLTLEQVRNHRFFKEVERSFSLPTSPGDVPTLGRAIAMKEVTVCQCDENYTFEGTHRCHSWPEFLDRASQTR
jgi:serine/threonine-protein kinase 11